MAKIIRENSFEGAPGGSAGTLNYGIQYGTPGGGNNTQNSDKFGARDLNKAPSHMGTEDTGSALPKLPERPDRVSSSGSPIHPAVMSDKGDFEDSNAPGDNPEAPNTIPYDSGGKIPSDNSSNDDPDTKTPDPQNKPIDPTKGLGGQVDKIFTKKITPTPDEVLSALQYEMNQMVKKDKYIAKQIVLKNLKEDPKYYSRLNMLNVDDEKMKVDENTTFSKTKAVLDQMISDKKKKNRPVQNSKEINSIFEDLWDKRHKDRNRK